MYQSTEHLLDKEDYPTVDYSSQWGVEALQFVMNLKEAWYT